MRICNAHVIGNHPWQDNAEKRAKRRIVTDLDPGSFCNNGGWKGANMAWLNDGREIASDDQDQTHPHITRKNGSVMETVKSAPLVAVRDIEKGEELLCYYSSFSEGLQLMIK